MRLPLFFVRCGLFCVQFRLCVFLAKALRCLSDVISVTSCPYCLSCFFSFPSYFCIFSVYLVFFAVYDLSLLSFPSLIYLFFS